MVANRIAENDPSIRGVPHPNVFETRADCQVGRGYRLQDESKRWWSVYSDDEIRLLLRQ